MIDFGDRMGTLTRQNAVGQECPTYILRLDKVVGRPQHSHHMLSFQRQTLNGFAVDRQNLNFVGAVRADYYAGAGAAAGELAGRVKQNLRLWVLWPR